MAQKFLVSDLKTANRLLIFITILFIISILLLLLALGKFEKKQNVLFNHDVNNESAYNFIGEFRNDWELRKRTKGIWYSADSIQRYLDTTFTDWKSKMPLPSSMSSDTIYEWGIGFYPMRHTDINGSKNRVDFLIVPTIMQRIKRLDQNNKIVTDTIIYDYYDAQQRAASKAKDLTIWRYYLKNKKIISGLCDTCTGFNAGHLWP